MNLTEAREHVGCIVFSRDPGSKAEAILRSGLVQRASNLPPRAPLLKPSGKLA